MEKFRRNIPCLNEQIPENNDWACKIYETCRVAINPFGVWYLFITSRKRCMDRKWKLRCGQTSLRLARRWWRRWSTSSFSWRPILSIFWQRCSRGSCCCCKLFVIGYMCPQNVQCWNNCDHQYENRMHRIDSNCPEMNGVHHPDDRNDFQLELGEALFKVHHEQCEAHDNEVATPDETFQYDIYRKNKEKWWYRECFFTYDG